MIPMPVTSPALTLPRKKLQEAVSFVHQHRRKLHIAINTFAHPDGYARWQRAVDMAAQLGADALILADLAMLEYAAERYPHIERHVSVQASATNEEAINFYHRHFDVARVVLPRVLSIHQVKQLARVTPVPLEVFAFGSLCIMSEGRCYLSSYLTGESPNTIGACSPARFVHWQQTPQGAGIPPERSADRPLSGRRKTQVIRRYVKGVIWWTASAITRWKNQPVSIPGNCCRS